MKEEDVKKAHLYGFRAGDDYYVFTPGNVSVYQVPPQYYRLACQHTGDDAPGKQEEGTDPEISRKLESLVQQSLQSAAPAEEAEKDSLKEIHLQVSHYCNLDCKYCYAQGGDYGGEAIKMDKETARQAVDFFLEALPKDRVGDLSFDGGEPLTNWDIIEDVTQYAVRSAIKQGKKLSFYIGTNGTLLTQRTHRLIKAAGMGVGVSIDGDQHAQDSNRPFNNQKGSYNTIEENVNAFIATAGNKNLQARGTITRENMDVTYTVKHLLSMGFKHIYLDPVSSTDASWQLNHDELQRLKQEFSKLAEFYVQSLMNGQRFIMRNFYLFIKRLHFKKKLMYKCGAGRNGIAVTPLGDIFPCYRFTSVPQYKMGNIKQAGIDPGFRQQFIANRVQQRPLCKECWARYLCGGGCPYHSIYKQGSMDINDAQECDFLLHMITLSLQIYVRVKKQLPDFWNSFFGEG